MRSSVLSILLIGLAVGMPEPEAGIGPEHVQLLSRMKRAGGACSSTADCVSGNVCSKWGWCQWTTIYGQDGPSQGASSPGGGVAGQCVTSADCASRVPYCSNLGFCHGGRLPFDEAQLEIPDEDKTNPFPQQPQGFINNNPPKNNPIISGRNKGGGKNGGGTGRKSGGGTKSGGGRNSGIGNNARNSGGRRNSSSGRNGSRTSGGTNGGRTNSSRNRGSQSKSRRRPPSSKASGARQGNNGHGKGKKTGNNQNSNRGGGSCPGGSIDACVHACVPIKKLNGYRSCVDQCGKRCGK